MWGLLRCRFEPLGKYQEGYSFVGKKGKLDAATYSRLRELIDSAAEDNHKKGQNQL
jgi:hypothetical protein